MTEAQGMSYQLRNEGSRKGGDILRKSDTVPKMGKGATVRIPGRNTDTGRSRDEGCLAARMPDVHFLHSCRYSTVPEFGSRGLRLLVA